MEECIITQNGINIYSYKQPNTHSVCISLYVRTGTLFEDDNIGISHFLEHIHFRNLGGKSQKELYFALESIGAYMGACTYKEFIRFYLTAIPKHFPGIAVIASDLLGKLDVDARDCAAEKRLIMSEIREANQNNDIKYYSHKYVWKNTTLVNPVLGSISSIQKIKSDKLKAEKEKVFHKDNIFYYVTGCFHDEDIRTLAFQVEQYDMCGRNACANKNIVQRPNDFMQRQAFVKLYQRDYLMHDICISFDFDLAKVTRHELLYLDDILIGGLSSRLRKELIEKRGLIYDISTTLEHYNNIGVYYFKFSVYISKIYKAVEYFVKTLKEVKKNISSRDIQTSIIFETDNKLKLLDDPDDLNWEMAYENHILNNNFEDLSEIANQYRIITRERLIEVANEVFQPNNVMLFSIGTRKGLSEKKLRDMLLTI